MLFTSALIKVLAKVFDAIVAPAVVEAVAAAIKIPDNGAKINGLRFKVSIKLIISVCKCEFDIIPESVPVPISRAQTPITFEKPYAEYSLI